MNHARKENLKILLIGNYLPDRQESMQRFAEKLERELRGRGHHVRLQRPPTRLNRPDAGFAGLEKWLGYVDKFILFPILLRQLMRGVDVVHICDHSNAPYIHTIRKKPHLITCNDVLAIRSALGLVPENPTRWSGRILQKYIVSGLNRAMKIACISQNSKKQLLEVTSCPEEKTEVIYMGENYPYSPMPIEEALAVVSQLLKKSETNDSISPEELRERGFIFHVGGNYWYKNRQGVLRIYERLRSLHQSGHQGPLPLLIMAGQPFTAEMQSYISQEGLTDVYSCVNVSNEELRALYSCARVMLFPSLAEGFGWPIVEAQACGCRVLTTNRAPMTEVGGTAAAYCQPEDETDVARRLIDLLDDGENETQSRVQAGLANAARFSTSQMVDQYLLAYRTVIEERTKIVP